MLITFSRIALRTLRQQKFLTFINISGLAVGMCCFILFAFYASNEYNYDTFHKNAKQLYRLIEWREGFPNMPARGDAYGGTAAAPALARDLPGVKQYARLQQTFDDKLVRAGDHVLRTKMSYADPALLHMFTFRFLDGNPNSALNGVANVVLTRKKAEQLFGETQVAGRRVDIRTDTSFVSFAVGAVVEDLPANSSIQFEVLGHFEHLLTTPMGRESLNNWYMTIGSQTFVQLEPNSDLPQQTDKFVAFREKYLPNEAQELVDRGEWNGKGMIPVRFKLQPLLSMHTDCAVSDGVDTANIWLLLGIAAGVLLIACINFTTLAIGRSAGRAKEVGVRKVMGSQRKQLVLQFLFESSVLSLLAACFSLLLVKLLLPFFNELTGTALTLSLLEHPLLLLIILGTILTTGLVAGFYPAFVLSGFKPVEVLKRKVRLGGSNIFTRSLVTLQFVFSVALLLATIVVLQQWKYMRDRHPGFNRENVVMINAEGTDARKIYPVLKPLLQGNRQVKAVSASEMGMGEGMGLMGMPFDVNGKSDFVFMYPVDENFIPAMGMQLIAGRNFDPRLASDTSGAVIVNEAFLSMFNIPAGKAIGTLVRDAFGNSTSQKEIIGVVRNFHFTSMKNGVAPQLFVRPSSLDPRKIYIKLAAGNPAHTLAAIRNEWENIVPGVPMEYDFLDDTFNGFYQNEQRWMKIIGAAGAACIFLACLGLFGLAALAAVNRTKEMGIRKVLGASTFSLVRLLSADFLKLVALSIFIAVPIAWFGMHNWLQNYEYRIAVSPLTFVVVALSTLLLSFVITAFHGVKSSQINPALHLRNE